MVYECVTYRIHITLFHFSVIFFFHEFFSQENDKNNASLTDLSFDDLCVKLQDAALDQDMLLVAFRKKVDVCVPKRTSINF